MLVFVWVFWEHVVCRYRLLWGLVCGTTLPTVSGLGGSVTFPRVWFSVLACRAPIPILVICKDQYLPLQSSTYSVQHPISTTHSCQGFEFLGTGSLPTIPFKPLELPRLIFGFDKGRHPSAASTVCHVFTHPNHTLLRTFWVLGTEPRLPRVRFAIQSLLA